jgi:cytochrome c551/c552
MNLKSKLGIVLAAGIVTIFACNSNDSASSDNATGDAPANNEGTNPKGIGKYANVTLNHPLDEKLVADGKNVYEVKCGSCHKLSDERLVGPGWKGVTDRRTPEWIMNFVTNVDEMIEKDTAAQRMLEQCLVRMPNQNLSDAEARASLEFMLKNDGKN